MDGDPAPNLRLLCKRLPEPVRLELVSPFVLRGNHAARYSAIGDQIIRRRGLEPWEDQWWLGHELGHRYRRRAGRPFDETEEAWCNAFAGALLVPAEPLLRGWQIGHDLGDLIERFPSVAPTCLALRLGEAELAETAIVQGAALRYVRTHHVVAPEVLKLGIEAARRGCASRVGLGKAWRLPEVPRRAAVVLDAA